MYNDEIDIAFELQREIFDFMDDEQIEEFKMKPNHRIDVELHGVWLYYESDAHGPIDGKTLYSVVLETSAGWVQLDWVEVNWKKKTVEIVAI